MKTLKRTLAVILALLLLSSSFVCFAADSGKVYHKYDKYVLLGDSIASGYTDFAYRNTEFTFAPNSYSDFLAQDLGAELVPLACPGFRTLEMRYIFEDDYRPQDKYLFNAIPNTPGWMIELMIPDIRREVSEADIITLGIGGNDWGAYLGWVMTEVQDSNKLPDEYIEELRKYLQTATFDDNIIAKIVDLAHKMNALDELIEAIPEAVKYGFGTYMDNWDHLIQDIYDLNPDVTLVVVGMYSSKYSTTKEAPDVVIESEPFKAYVEQMIIDYANKPMIESADKFGYIYVDTEGTIVEVSHPNVAGNRFIADRILEALPDARFPYTDVSVKDAEYKAVEYMFLNDIMSGTSATTFSPDEVLTKAQLSEALNKINDTYTVTDSTAEVSKLNFAIALVKASAKTDIISLFKTLVFAMKIMVSGFGNVTRAEAAVKLYEFINL